MIAPSVFYDALISNGVDFFTGVPDSLLKDFCGYISDNASINKNIISANEGSALSIAAGYNIATGKLPLVYLQNSGLGNLLNPLLSLADKEVYSIPMILLIGWRGEPGHKDEPQHIKQGRVQNSILDAIEVPYFILDSTVAEVSDFITDVVETAIIKQAPVAIIVREKSFFEYKIRTINKNTYKLTRENAIVKIMETMPDDCVIVSTTGKASREVYENQNKINNFEQRVFLTVGSMGHCSQIALGIALNSSKKVVCIDGDGSVIMHMGSMAIIGDISTMNFYHFVLNNGAHESVGGQRTVGLNISLQNIAKSCGYKYAVSFSTAEELESNLTNIFQTEGPVFIEVKVNIESRSDLGRPKSHPRDNRTNLMKFLSS